MTYPIPQPNIQHFMVIGNPINHSKSPEIHQAFAKQAGINIHYARQLCPDDAASFVACVQSFFNGGGIGANVTVPFKQIAFDWCLKHGGVSKHAKVAGAVNTLLLKEGKIVGDNTDGQGLVNHLIQLGWPLNKANVVIIGAGGASRGVILPLIEAGVRQLTIANRTLSKADTLVAELGKASATVASIAMTTNTIEQLTEHFDIIINATSIGLSGGELPLSKTLTCDYAYDMMYGRDLPFLNHFANIGAQTSTGYGMLIGQAALSFERWTGATIDSSLITELG